jgi:hypothetical protein
MSPRVIQMPLSGGDRKHYARELRRVESLHAGLVKKVQAAYSAAEEHLRLAHRLECEEWNARLFLGGDETPSPTIAAAIDASASLLEVKCNACRTTSRIDLADVIWPRRNQVHTLRPKLFCEPCKVTTGRKVRPALIGLFDPNPEPEVTSSKKRASERR